MSSSINYPLTLEQLIAATPVIAVARLLKDERVKMKCRGLILFRYPPEPMGLQEFELIEILKNPFQIQVPPRIKVQEAHWEEKCHEYRYLRKNKFPMCNAKSYYVPDEAKSDIRLVFISPTGKGAAAPFRFEVDNAFESMVKREMVEDLIESQEKSGSRSDSVHFFDQEGQHWTETHVTVEVTTPGD